MFFVLSVCSCGLWRNSLPPPQASCPHSGSIQYLLPVNYYPACIVLVVSLSMSLLNDVWTSIKLALSTRMYPLTKHAFHICQDSIPLCEEVDQKCCTTYATVEFCLLNSISASSPPTKPDIYLGRCQEPRWDSQHPTLPRKFRCWGDSALIVLLSSFLPGVF